jgi:hypothetical protein
MKPKLDPYSTYIEKDGKKLNKVHVLYIDGDIKICDCCDEKKTGVASIKTLGDLMCICQECVSDILTIWPDEWRDNQLNKILNPNEI